MNATTAFQSSLAPEMVHYIALKQALGRNFKTSSAILLTLDRFLCTLGMPSSAGTTTASMFKLSCRSWPPIWAPVSVLSTYY